MTTTKRDKLAELIDIEPTIQGATPQQLKEHYLERGYVNGHADAMEELRAEAGEWRTKAMDVENHPVVKRLIEEKSDLEAKNAALEKELSDIKERFRPKSPPESANYEYEQAYEDYVLCVVPKLQDRVDELEKQLTWLVRHAIFCAAISRAKGAEILGVPLIDLDIHLAKLSGSSGGGNG